MFPILKTKKEIEELEAKGFKQGVDFIVGMSYGKSRGLYRQGELEERWEIKYPNTLT